MRRPDGGEAEVMTALHVVRPKVKMQAVDTSYVKACATRAQLTRRLGSRRPPAAALLLRRSPYEHAQQRGRLQPKL
jgi:hypothetical protein